MSGVATIRTGPTSSATDEAAVLARIRAVHRPHRPASAQEVASALGLDLAGVNRAFRALEDRGEVSTCCNKRILYATPIRRQAPLTAAQRDKVERYLADAYAAIRPPRGATADDRDSFVHDALIDAVRRIPPDCRDERRFVFAAILRHRIPRIGRRLKRGPAGPLPRWGIAGLDSGPKAVDDRDEVEYLTRDLDPLDRTLLVERYGYERSHREQCRRHRLGTNTVHGRIQAALRKARERADGLRRRGA